MITHYREGLYRIYERVPLYGIGTPAELNHQFVLYRDILYSIAAMDRYKVATESLIEKSKNIQALISAVNNDPGESERAYFENTLKMLSEDICSLLQILKFTTAN